MSSLAPRRTLGALAATLALAALLVTLATMAREPEPAEAASCADVLFVGARGSGEPESAGGGMGVPIARMANSIKQAVLAFPEDFGARPVRYTAAPVEKLVPSKAELVTMAATGSLGIGNPAAGVAGLSGAAAFYYGAHLRPYMASIEDGVKKTVRLLHDELAGCPETEFVLAGYSQGAIAIHQAELRLERDGDFETLDAIAGTLLLGNGDRVAGSKATLVGGAPRGARGIRVVLHAVKARDVAESETTIEICVKGDIVCDFDLEVGAGSLSKYRAASHVHTSYDEAPQSHYLDVAAQKLAARMGLLGRRP
jgi:cutinase